MAAGRIHNFAFFLLTFYFLKLINQFESIMQNKPNFRKSQMNVNKVSTRDYEKKTLGEHGKNKPNTNPIQTQFKPNFPKSKIDAKCVFTKDYEE